MLLSEWPALPLHVGAVWPVVVVPAPEGAQRRRVEEREGLGQPILPADPASPVLEPAGPAQSACLACGSPFEPKPRKKYCNDVCRRQAYLRRKAANGEAPEPAAAISRRFARRNSRRRELSHAHHCEAPAPEPEETGEWQRPFLSPLADQSEHPELLEAPPLPWEQREQA